MKKYFALKLNARRTDFINTMSDEEKSVMHQHVAYWQPYLENGTMIVLGPVLDPAAPYGLGVIGVDSEEELKYLLKNDPASTINDYEYFPMLAVVGKLSV